MSLNTDMDAMIKNVSDIHKDIEEIKELLKSQYKFQEWIKRQIRKTESLED